MAVPVSGHISVAGRKASADIDLLTGGGTLMHHRRGSKERPGAAIGTFNVDVFHGDTFFLSILCRLRAGSCTKETIFNCVDVSGLPCFQLSFQYAPLKGKLGP
jgi:hypothetical protein